MTESPQDDLGFELPPPARGSRGLVVVVLAIVVGGLFTLGYLKHHSARGDSPIVTAENGAIRVEVQKPTVVASDRALTLPGVVRPLEEAKIYARSQGYVRRWLVDIGDKVKEDQLLAEIETPELDAQLAQARAQLAQAKAS